MFSIYLADLNNFQASKCTGLDYLNNIQEEPLNDELTTFLKLYLLMYADATVLLESPEDLQTSLNTMKDYCSMFDLDINIDKTKVMIFSRGKLRKPHYFNYGDQNIEVVNEYNYLGLVFNYNAKFNVAKNNFISKRGKSSVFIVEKNKKNVITC